MGVTRETLVHYKTLKDKGYTDFTDKIKIKMHCIFVFRFFMMITLGEMLDLTRTSGNEPLDTGDEEVTGDEKEPVVNCSGYINGELFFAVVTRMNARLKEAHEKAVEAEKRIEDLVEQLEELQE